MSLKGLFVAAASFLILVGCSGGDETYIRNKVVRLVNDHNECSGEQVQAPSGQNYILSAGHCRLIADKDGNIEIHTEDGAILKRRVIAEDPKSDLLLIEGLPNVQGLKIGKSSRRLQEVRTFTHGSNLDTYETDGVIVEDQPIKVGAFEITNADDEARCKSMPKFEVIDEILSKICVINVRETVTTAKIVPGSSGGVVVNSRGEVVGVASATDGNFGYLVTLRDIQSFLAGY